MATVAEQLKSASITDSLKYESLLAAETAGWKKLVWATVIAGTWGASGWKPPGYAKHEPDGSVGGAWLSNKKQTGGNSFAYLVSPTFGTNQAGGGAEPRQRSVWLYTTGEGMANGYQLRCKDTVVGSSIKYMMRLSKYTAGAETLIKEVEVEIEANGGFALASASGKLGIYIRKTEAASWVLVGAEEFADTTFKEGFSGVDGNGSNPTLINFATGVLTVGTAPTATTEAALLVKKNSAELRGLVNPKGTATNCWFEYGTTTSYGFKTAVKPAGAGSSNVLAHEIIEGLKPGSTYHFRLVAESVNGRTNGADFSFVTTGTKIRQRRKPSLALDVEIETPDGTYRLPAGAKNPRNKPRNISFGTQRGEGFGIATVTLSREIFKDYPDIGLLDTWRFINQSGDIVYEGRLQSIPRLNDPEEEIAINLIGWMSYLRGKKISPLLIESRLSLWGDPSTQRRINLINSNVRCISPTVGWADTTATQPGVVADFTSIITSTGRTDRLEAWFYGGGEDIGGLLYCFKNLVGAGSESAWETKAYLVKDDGASSYDPGVEHNGFTNSNPYETLGATVSGRKYALLISSRFDNSNGVALPDIQCWDYPKILGTHGLTLRGSYPNIGVGLTDAMRYVVQTYYPKIKWAGEDNNYTVQQATWHDGSQFGYDILKQLNNLALWELNMWENRELHFEAADLTKIDWQFKTTDEGVKVNFEGDSIENFANGCSVRYTDFSSISHTLYPTDHAELRDENEDNPYNQHDEDGWTDCDIPYQCSEAEALQFGIVYLEEFNRPKRPGSYTITGGYIKDAAGHRQPGFGVRNGQTAGIMDKIDDEPRLIVATNWDDTTKALNITVDAPDKLLDAIVARQELVRTAKGL